MVEWSGNPVHPHACGERQFPEPSGVNLAGSSPRLWGTECPGRGAKQPWRFIPTPVGNGLITGVPGSGKTVHPHACGERRLCPGRIDTGSGSSPRLWGTGERTPNRVAILRFIPTPVGNGYNNGVIRQEITGSSPRLWGTVLIAKRLTSGVRFIPPPVGNGFLSFPLPSLLTVHPHACGERGFTAAEQPANRGSSPRLWGTGDRRTMRS